MGSANITNYIHEPCPICGHKEWCGWFEDTKSLLPGAKLNLCHRVLEGGNVSGFDGKTYIYIKATPEGSLYEEEEQRIRSKELWLEKNGYTKNSKQSNQRQEAKAPIVEKKVVPEIESRARTDSELDEIYHAMLSLLILEDAHRDAFVKDGWTDELLTKACIKSLPVDDRTRWFYKKENGKELTRNIYRWKIVDELQRRFGEDLSGIPGFYKMKTCDKSTGEIIYKWRLAGSEGILIPVTNRKGQIIRLRVRMDHTTTGGKYRNLATNPNKKDKNGEYLYPCGTESGSHISVVYHPEVDMPYVAYITEGEKKGILGNATVRAPFYVLPGTGTFSKLLLKDEEGISCVDHMRMIGVSIVVIAFDADKAVNKHVMAAEEKTVEILKQEGFKVAMADWNPAFGKGIDDILAAGLRPNLSFI